VKQKSPFSLVRIVALLSGSVGTLPAALPPEKLAQLPLASTARVDFVRDIQPIFEASCVQCHARGKEKGSFSLETRADFLEGGDTGAPAVAGKSAERVLVRILLHLLENPNSTYVDVFLISLRN
jgi:hypothetical protein